LIAIWLILNGCNGILALATIRFSGLWNEIGPNIAAHFHPVFSLHFIEHVILAAYLSLGIAYIVIGVGLWKLKNWARQILGGLSTLCAVICGIVFPGFSRHFDVLAFGMFLTGAAMFAGLAFYLMRPSVRIAFRSTNPE
jgi:hypothetical protein